MSGIAQRLFSEKFGSKVGLEGDLPASKSILQALLQEGYPITLENAMAERILNGVDNVPEAVVAFVCYLCLAVKQGHLCVSDGPEGLKPDPTLLLDQIQAEKRNAPVDPNLIRQFDHLLRQGANLLLALYPFSDALASLVFSDGRYYLKRFWNYESLIIEHLDRLLKHPPTLTVDSRWSEAQLLDLQNAAVLKQAQAEAIRRACKQCVTLIAGGPGTGKTYTAAQMIALIARGMRQSGHQDLHIALAAPTGKAAANLSASLGKALEEFGITARAQTLHALLGIGKRSDDEEWDVATLGADLVVVDEGSMVDAYLMARLLSAVKEGARLVILGDIEQLPSVQAGGVFADIVTGLAYAGGPVVLLDQCMRTDSPKILNAAAAILKGDIGSLRSLVHNWESGEDEHLWQAVVDHCTPLLTLSAALPNDVLCCRANEVRLLTPLRDGPWGVEQLNGRLLNLAWQAQKSSPRAVPIIVTANDYRLGLFNGDVGVLICHGREPTQFRTSEADYALFVTAGGEIQRIDAIRLPRYEYAYCLSVHRSQGSEYDRVLLLLPSRSEVFGREIVYTGVTRARREVEIWSSEHTLEAMIGRRMQRLSGLRERLRLEILK